MLEAERYKKNPQQPGDAAMQAACWFWQIRTRKKGQRPISLRKRPLWPFAEAARPGTIALADSTPSRYLSNLWARQDMTISYGLFYTTNTDYRMETATKTGRGRMSDE